jgi:phosphinothricin acetyltransferase
MNISIRAYQPGDWKHVSEIYVQGINTKNATFDTKPFERADWEAKQFAGCSLIAVCGVEIAGWASIGITSAREAYKGVGEVSIYVSNAYKGKGIGKKLLNALIETSEQNGVWTIQASIFPENEASINLHKKCGFREVGIREKIGKMDGVWRDTVLLEKRSKNI